MSNTNTESVQTFAFADEVWHRVVQIVQEALLTGVDCSDLLRQVRVQESDNVLVLTPAYRQMVKENFEKMLVEAEKLREASQASKIIGV